MKLPPSVEKVLKTVLGPDGASKPGLRNDLFRAASHAADKAGEQVAPPPELQPFVEKLIHTPYKLLDRDIENLRSEGFSEDQIFELTLATALGSGVGRLALTRRLIEESQS